MCTKWSLTSEINFVHVLASLLKKVTILVKSSMSNFSLNFSVWVQWKITWFSSCMPFKQEHSLSCFGVRLHRPVSIFNRWDPTLKGVHDDEIRFCSSMLLFFYKCCGAQEWGLLICMDG